MKNRFCAALLLAAFCVTLFTGCASVSALNRPSSTLEVLIPQESTPLAAAPAAPVTPAATEPKQITKEEAVSIALAHANLTEDQITHLRTEFGYDDGQPEYEVDFHYGGWEYDYDIHALTGKILRSECEPADSAPAKNSEIKKESAQEPTQAPAQAVKERLTKDEASAIALKHAGLTAADVTRLRTQFDYDDGRPEYDVDFHHDGYEYDYEIHAETGKILSIDKDRDD